MNKSSEEVCGNALIVRNLETLRSKAAALPLSPGVYIMLDQNESIIYIGKSRYLRDRVSQYFHGSHDIKTERMAASVADFRFIACDTEMEALALENALIKQHKPKYNIRLKDAKSYPYIKLSLGEEYPRLSMTRTRLDDGAAYFGPYSGTSVVYSVIATLERALGIPSCSRKFPRDIGKERPCVYRQIGRCIGVCAGDVSHEEYMEMIKSAEAMLKGGLRSAISKLEERMNYCADELLFEEAARCRDSIEALRKVGEKQKTVGEPDLECDVIAMSSFEGKDCGAILYIRGGMISDSDYFVFGSDEIIGGFSSPSTAPDDELPLISFITALYREREYIPREIWLGFDVSEHDLALLTDFFKSRAAHAVKIKIPVRGNAKQLCLMAQRDAVHHAELEARERDKSERLLFSLARQLSLEVVPERIEVWDISNLGSEHITAGMIVAEDGKLKKSDYRVFKINSLDQPDDYAAMREAVLRRMEHISSQDDASFSSIPDLILLDGGEAHVGVIKRALSEHGYDIPVFGMVKDSHHKTRTLTTDAAELSIARDGEVFRFIYSLQEEVHRFTVSRMSGAKRKTLRTSSLEKIDGIGPTKAKKLLTRFKTLSAIRAASLSELAATDGISSKDAQNIISHFSAAETNKP